uniref:Uncharacterized protein n=1 Tax=Hemiselmis tepida TaxID=464990 RepID=A0A7S0W0X2_9CRYP|mmetsp:Transcript_32031/g.81552  ORF Transcript_32031/g.81552 Transcript_32031/m.81552 type:complete len:173 (+) Transcript_32031:250-768(+)
MALPFVESQPLSVQARSATERRAALATAAAAALVVACVLSVSSTAGGPGGPRVELAAGEGGKEMARVCFGKVCATTSARFAKVLQGTEKTIFAQGERRGEEAGAAALVRRARAGQEAVARVSESRQQHLHEVSEAYMRRKQQREERREDAAERAKSRPVWHSEWRHIFGSQS